jgi:D-alanine--poly(phosphoribitol) ligase subunit 2
MQPDNVKGAIHAKISELARQLGNDASGLKNDQEIPATGLLDSAGLMELILWFETTYGLSIDEDQITMDNFGTINAMANYLEQHATR